MNTYRSSARVHIQTPCFKVTFQDTKSSACQVKGQQEEVVNKLLGYVDDNHQGVPAATSFINGLLLSCGSGD